MNLSILSSSHSRFPKKSYKTELTIEWYLSVPEIQKLRIIQDCNIGGTYFRIIGYTSSESYFDVISKIDEKILETGNTIEVDNKKFVCSIEKPYIWWFTKE